MTTTRLAAVCLAALMIAMAVSPAAAQVVPPIDLNAELLQGGQVALTWAEPPDGLFEDFEDGVAQDFEFLPEPSWTVEDGYLKVTPGTGWQSAWHEGVEFDDFTLEAEFQNVASTNSRGVLFRANGPQSTGSIETASSSGPARPNRSPTSSRPWAPSRTP